MLVSIDGEEYPELLGEGQTLGKLLDQAKALTKDGGKMIVAIECDGQVLVPDEMNASLAENAEKYWQINFQTAVPGQLASEVLVGAKQTLAQINTETEKVAERLNQSQVKEAMDILGKICMWWNDVYRGVFNTLQLLRIDPESIELANGTAAIAMSKLLERLRDVKVSLENQDYVQLADLLAYELSPLSKDWQAIVDTLLAQLGDEEEA